eukprot:1863102-Rhodomonas_salina.1
MPVDLNTVTVDWAVVCLGRVQGAGRNTPQQLTYDVTCLPYLGRDTPMTVDFRQLSASDEYKQLVGSSSLQVNMLSLMEQLARHSEQCQGRVGAFDAESRGL